MKMWTLILIVHSVSKCGGDHHAVALERVPGFESQEACIGAGNISKRLVDRAAEELHFTCLETMETAGYQR